MQLTFKCDGTGDMVVQVCDYNNGNVSIRTSDYFEATGWMLNEGSVAAPFERAGGTIGGELALCQRYYEKSWKEGVSPGTGTTDGFSNVNGYSSSSAYKNHTTFLKVPKRLTTPTVHVYDYDGNIDKISTLDTAEALTNNVSYTTLVFTDKIITVKINSTVVGLVYHWTVDAEIV
jgi:hypothetical protein